MLFRSVLIPGTVTLSLDNAGDLVTKAGVTVRAKAECEAKFTDLLATAGARLERKEVIEKAFVKRANNDNDNANDNEPGGSDNEGGGSGSDSGSGSDGGSGSTGGSTNPGSGNKPVIDV